MPLTILLWVLDFPCADRWNDRGFSRHKEERNPVLEYGMVSEGTERGKKKYAGFNSFLLLVKPACYFFFSDRSLDDRNIFFLPFRSFSLLCRLTSSPLKGKEVNIW